MSGRRYEIASYLARVRLLLQARVEARPVAGLLPRGDLEWVKIIIVIRLILCRRRSGGTEYFGLRRDTFLSDLE